MNSKQMDLQIMLRWCFLEVFQILRSNRSMESFHLMLRELMFPQFASGADWDAPRTRAKASERMYSWLMLWMLSLGWRRIRCFFLAFLSWNYSYIAIMRIVISKLFISVLRWPAWQLYLKITASVVKQTQFPQLENEVSNEMAWESSTRHQPLVI